MAHVSANNKLGSIEDVVGIRMLSLPVRSEKMIYSLPFEIIDLVVSELDLHRQDPNKLHRPVSLVHLGPSGQVPRRYKTHDHQVSYYPSKDGYVLYQDIVQHAGKNNQSILTGSVKADGIIIEM